MKTIGTQTIYDQVRFKKDISLTSFTLDSISISTIQASSESFADNNTSLMTSAAIADKIEAYGYSTTTGRFTGITFYPDDLSNYASWSLAGNAFFRILGGEGINTTATDQLNTSSPNFPAITITGEDASDSNKGIVELATTAETTTGTSTTLAVTPDGLKDGYQGSSNVATLGTITTGAWEGDVIASAFLDGDTAHLSGTQTFTGTKIFDGNRNVTPGDGAVIHVDTHDVTDTNTSESGTAAKYTHVSIEHPRLLATNASVTTTDAATLHITGAPAASTNQTITNAWAILVEAGDVTLGGELYMGDTRAMDTNGLLRVADQSTITGLGTISSGRWEGTAVATGYTKHLVHYDFQGYSTGNGTNWEISKQVSANTAPFNHDNSTGSDGLTAMSVQTWVRGGGKTMPKACTLKRITGWSTCAGSSTANIGLFKVTPVRDDSGTVSAVELADISYTAMGNAKMEDHDVTSFTATAIAAGDILFTALKSASGAIQYSNITVEVEF